MNNSISYIWSQKPCTIIRFSSEDIEPHFVIIESESTNSFKSSYEKDMFFDRGRSSFILYSLSFAESHTDHQYRSNSICAKYSAEYQLEGYWANEFRYFC